MEANQEHNLPLFLQVKEREEFWGNSVMSTSHLWKLESGGRTSQCSPSPAHQE